MEKPLYNIPSMGEILKVPLNGLKVISTFSGCGGSCLGFRMAGFETIWASEFVKAARDTYRENHPNVYVDGNDIRSVTPEDILERVGMEVGEVDVLEGSPPCASFSMAGKRSQYWGEVKPYSDRRQRTDDLFFELARLIGGIRPKVFVAENVSGLVRGKAKGYFKEILTELKRQDYYVKAALLNAKWLGVPQSRERIIFIGVRKDIGIQPKFPVPLPYFYSVRDALPWVDTARTRANVDVNRPSPTVQSHGRMHTQSELSLPAVEPESRMDRYAVGAEWDKLHPGQSSQKYFNLTRPSLGQACPTVTAEGGNPSLASVTHPTEKRKFSIPELRRICGFPDDFILTGTYSQQWERLGRAVPPPMMYHVATTIRDEVLLHG